MKFIKNFFSKLYRLVTLQDIWPIATTSQQVRLATSVVVTNAIESTSKILGPLALAKTVEMIAANETTTEILGCELSSTGVFYCSVFFSLVSLLTPEARMIYLYGIEQRVAQLLTERTLVASQAKTSTTPKHLLGSDVLKPLQKNLYGASQSIPKLLPIVSDNIQPLICDTIIGTIITFSRFGSPVGSVLIGYIVLSTLTNELVSYLTKTDDRSNKTAMQFTTFVRNWFDALCNAETVTLFNRDELELKNALADFKTYIDMQKDNFLKERASISQILLTSLLQVAASVYVARGSFHTMRLDDIVFLLSYAASISSNVSSINHSVRAGMSYLTMLDELYELLGTHAPSKKPVKDNPRITLSPTLFYHHQLPRLKLLSAQPHHHQDEVIIDMEFSDEDIAHHIKSALYAIEFNQVSFAYNEDKYVLNNLNFKIPAGKTVAIVGTSNCGKTTLTKLICGLLSPTNSAAEIKLFGMDMQSIPKQKLRQIIGISRQQVELFKESPPAYNIYYGFAQDEQLFSLRQDKPDDIEEYELAKLTDRLNEVSVKTKLTGIIDRAKSTGLSGGEEQRLGIARILSKHAKLFIFDEPTSQLDSKTEAALLANITEVTAGKTVIMIAHRLSTIKHADHILVMQNDSTKGTSIVEQGTHQELLAADGVYAELWELQTKDTAPRL